MNFKDKYMSQLYMYFAELEIASLDEEQQKIKDEIQEKYEEQKNFSNKGEYEIKYEIIKKMRETRLKGGREKTFTPVNNTKETENSAIEQTPTGGGNTNISTSGVPARQAVSLKVSKVQITNRGKELSIYINGLGTIYFSQDQKMLHHKPSGEPVPGLYIINLGDEKAKIKIYDNAGKEIDEQDASAVAEIWNKNRCSHMPQEVPENENGKEKEKC